MNSEGFLAKNIAGFTGALESVIATEDFSRKPGIVQTIDPRVKVATLVLFIILVSLMHNFWGLATIFGIGLILSILARISTSLFLKRVFLFLPFTLIVALPAVFITPGQPLVEIGSRVIITEQGVRTAGFLICRVIDSISLGMLLILTTSWADVLVSLRWFRLPPLLVDILGMTYRYIFLLLHLTNSMFLARRSRLIAGFSGGENRRWLARSLGTVMARSQYLSEEVYRAMLSRGYDGEIKSLKRLTMKSHDYIWLTASIVIFTGLLWGNYLWA